jgi:hypothetical protein
MRRCFMKIIGGAAAGWPLATNAEQRERMRRIGVILPFAADDPESSARIAGLLQGLSELGWTVGRNIRIDYRWGASNGDRDRVCRSAAELLGLAPDVVVAGNSGIVAASTVSSYLLAMRQNKISLFDPCFPVSQSTINPWAGMKLARWWLI